MIRLYDTVKREKTPLTQREEGKVGIYVCGPTVYDMCHVGHARVYVAFDVVVRHMRRRGLDVTYVRNVTDVDDKIIARAGEADPPADPIALSAHFTDEFRADMDALGNGSPDHEPKVSEHIPDIVKLIEEIIAAGHAYEAEGDVYFEVESFSDYGVLSRRNLDDLRAGARVEVDRRKRGPMDFALWKAAKPGEPSWESPWGPGRPGWHIECSAMSSRYLGDSFDIHGGGMDLIFPHHENEIAQSRAITGPGTYAQHWMHNGFINVRTTAKEEEKMSKSLGNFFTIREVIARHEPEALRLFLLGTHYRKPLSFELDRSGEDVRFVSLEDAELRLHYAYVTLARLREALSVGKEYGPGAVLPPADDFVERFNAVLDDDFNTAAAVGLTSELLTLANKLLDQPKSAPKDQRRRTLRATLEALEQVSDALGVFGQDPTTFLERRRAHLCRVRGITPEQVEQAITNRNEARKAKDFQLADDLRKELTEMGVELMDGPGGTTWKVLENA